MCPDYQMLSVYLDGELPSPWKEKMEEHLARCVRCRDKLNAYRDISQRLGGTDSSAGEAARERVWLRLQTLEAPRRRQGPAIWRRRVSIPLPAVAAAAVILCIALAAAWFRQDGAVPQLQDMTAGGVDLDVRGIVPVSDIHGVLQYLGNQDTGEIVILRLPESRNFMSSGEPTILKAAELPARFSGGAGSADYSSGRNRPR